MEENQILLDDKEKEVFIVPHTHWDREWYKPFQEFRFKLVGLIDELINTITKSEYFFTLDGQTIVLEDYFEIRPENKEKLLELIRKGYISVGPWYLLPDEWLVGQESIIRNLEMSYDFTHNLKIPQMKIAYLPDQFGHTRAVPQIISDLTDISCAVIWRGVGPEINTVPFFWKSHKKAKNGILTNYLPNSYGNAATLSNQLDMLRTDIKSIMKDLDKFSPLPIYLLMNGTDHQYPQTKLINLVPDLPEYHVRIALLQHYIDRLQELIKKYNYTLPKYSGEFRSSVRAPLLQDTYSSRIWIKQWDNKVEDLFVHYVEPMVSYLHVHEISDYPTGFVQTAWKWLLKNQPHDSICGCSIDQTHEEMKTRYSWAEKIGDTILEDVEDKLNFAVKEGNETYCLTFNPTNNGSSPMLIEFQIPSKLDATYITSDEGKNFLIQKVAASETVVFENTFKPFFLKTGVKMLQGRKIMDVYLNGVEMEEDLSDPTLFHITLLFGKRLVGEFDVQKLKERAIEIVKSGKYKKFHVKATLGLKQSYNSMLPLRPWTFNQLKIGLGNVSFSKSILFEVSANNVKNKFYELKFNSNGTIDLFDKITQAEYKNLHEFEDWGDRGDEYTFGRVGPQRVKVSKVNRKLVNQGPLLCDIEQNCILTIFKELGKDRTKRIGKAKIPVTSRFRFYRDISRIDVTTTLINTAKDHRLRIGFNLPFKSETSLTSTHFGFIERQGNAFEVNEFAEMPSGIQAQKKFIRVNEDNGSNSLTVFNKGLPEVELVNNSKIALTLVRCIGHLSRQDFPERPVHAGPPDATPGAQEMNTEYIYRYGFMTHEKTLPMNETYNQAESFALPTKSFSFTNAEINGDLTQPFVSIPESMIKISSMRIRKGNLLVLIYNLDEHEIEINAQVTSDFHSCSEILIDGSEKKKLTIENQSLNLNFDPFEIKLLKFN